MRDQCVACGRDIFTTRLEGHGITLAQRWTHGGFGIIDRTHMPIPKRHKFKVIKNR